MKPFGRAVELPIHRCEKAAVNAPQSRRFAKFLRCWKGAKRLDCGGFSTAFEIGIHFFQSDSGKDGANTAESDAQMNQFWVMLMRRFF